MKNKFILYILSGLLFLTSCNDFLEIAPEDQITSDNFYQTAEQLNMATRGLYNIPWFDYNDKSSFSIGDGAGGNFRTNDGAYQQFMTFSVTGSNVRLNEAWRSLYLVIAQSNSVIVNVQEKSSASIDSLVKKQAIAEAKFMRAVAYFYLVRLWGPVPIIEDNVKIIDNPLLHTNKIEDVYQFIINDLNFAAKYLPETQAELGKVTKWSAKGMLSKVYLTRAGLGQNLTRNQGDLDMAKEIAGDVCKNSGLSLMKNYADLFLLANNNNPESLFALQWVDNQTNWGAQNTNQAYFAALGKLTGAGDGWGGSNGATPDLMKVFEESENDTRRKATYMLYGDFYPELLKKEGGYTYEEKSEAGSAIKKYVIGTKDDNGGKVAFMSTSINTYMMRLAEVYLIYAEAILGNQQNTTDADALKYFNMVRDRALGVNYPGASDKASLTFDDIWKERRLELAMESQFWFDLIRLHYYNPAQALSIVNSQDRGKWNWEGTTKTVVSEYYKATDANFVFPYPEAETANNPFLTQPPVDYKFN